MKNKKLTIGLLSIVFAFWLGICHNAGYNHEYDVWKTVCVDMWLGQGHK